MKERSDQNQRPIEDTADISTTPKDKDRARLEAGTSVGVEPPVLLDLPEDRRQLIDHTVNQVLREKHCAMVSRSADETFELARRLAECLQTAAIFLLSGDLGAGKTVFTKGIAAGLGIDPADITSPTFTLINVHRGRRPLYHVDLYRLERASTANIGLEDVLEDPGNVVVIEWAERLDYPAPAAFSVDLEHMQDTERKLTLKHR
jgi:tRNA threonylcarbamoyladenosine biosynthesis protein TsaE